MKIQTQYDKIYSFFTTTTEPFDQLEWDGYQLNVWLDDHIIETYYLEDIQQWFILNPTKNDLNSEIA
ncbi:MAG: hypothetical protein LBF04_05875 [Prevotellaceae bacterium]|jgi:hypothetical protein|nr:hypothetical protein [Prevotellaceae bacterium]